MEDILVPLFLGKKKRTHKKEKGKHVVGKNKRVGLVVKEEKEI